MKKNIYFLTLLSVSLIFWQNCSRVQLAPEAVVLKSEVPKLDFKTTICPQIQTQPPQPANFLFVVHMGSSNIGKWINPRGDYWYQDKNAATDRDGARFDAIQYFLNNCASQNGARFAVIGFSDNAGIPSGSGNNATWNCTNVTFGNASQAASRLNTLKQVQESAKPWYDQWSQATNNYLTSLADQPPLVRGTSYTEALSCAQQVVTNDLLSGNSGAESYQVVFIAGYNPDEQEGSNCKKPGATAAEVQACYLKNINTSVAYLRQSALTQAKDLRLYSVVYGDTQANVSDFQNALASNGGTAGPMYLSSFQGNQDSLCKLIASQLSVLQRPDSFLAVNMTTTNRQNELYADSDMDGMTDIEEIAGGYNPTKPRTVPGVLDGVCKRIASGVVDCQAKVNQIQCNQNRYYNLLSDCDVKLLNLTQVPSGQSIGVDFDNDGMPDFLEIIKGTNPSLADATSDPDGDSVSNRQEILQSTDSFTPDINFPVERRSLVSVNFDPNAKDCNGGGWVMSIPYTSISETQNVQGQSGNLSILNHQSNDQVLWLGYRLVPMNSSNLNIEHFNKVITIRLTKGGIVQQSVSNPSNSGSFDSIGEVIP